MKRLFSIAITLVLFGLYGCGGGGGGGAADTPPPPPLLGKIFGGAGDDYGMSVVQSSSGEYVVAGGSNSAGATGYDVYVLKANASGVLLASTLSGRSGNDFAYSIEKTSDGGYIVTGVYDTTTPGPEHVLVANNPGQLFLRKLDADLQLVWETTPAPSPPERPYSVGFSVRQTSDGGYIVAGATSFNIGGGASYLLKTDASGAKQWDAHLDGKFAADVRQTPDGGYIVAITSIIPAGALVKTDASGQVLWTQTGGGSGTARAVANLTAGGYVVTGETNAPDPAFDLYLARLTADGVPLWLRYSGAAGGDAGYAIQETADFGYVAAGEGSAGGDNHGFDVYVLKTDAGGNLQWQRFFGGFGEDRGRAVRQTLDGGYVIAGFTRSSPAQRADVYLIKTDSNGSSQW